MERMLPLVGLSETYCNKLIVRYDEGIIVDFVQFFRDEWGTALFHDRFADFRNSVAKTWAAEAKLTELTDKLSSADIPLAEKTALLLTVPTDLRGEVEKELFQFLKSNMDLLPMYVPLDN